MHAPHQADQVALVEVVEARLDQLALAEVHLAEVAAAVEVAVAAEVVADLDPQAVVVDPQVVVAVVVEVVGVVAGQPVVYLVEAPQYNMLSRNLFRLQ